MCPQAGICAAPACPLKGSAQSGVHRQLPIDAGRRHWPAARGGFLKTLGLTNLRWGRASSNSCMVSKGPSPTPTMMMPNGRSLRTVSRTQIQTDATLMMPNGRSLRTVSGIRRSSRCHHDDAQRKNAAPGGRSQGPRQGRNKPRAPGQKLGAGRLMRPSELEHALGRPPGMDAQACSARHGRTSTCKHPAGPGNPQVHGWANDMTDGLPGPT